MDTTPPAQSQERESRRKGRELQAAQKNMAVWIVLVTIFLVSLCCIALVLGIGVLSWILSSALNATLAFIVVLFLRPSDIVPALAVPFNWIYSKKDLEEHGMEWHQKNINGSGPFMFVQHQPGSFVDVGVVALHEDGVRWSTELAHELYVFAQLHSASCRRLWTLLGRFSHGRLEACKH